MLTGDDMMEMGMLNWLSPPSASTLCCFSLLPLPPRPFPFFPPFFPTPCMCRKQNVRLFPSRHCTVWQWTRAVYHWMTPSVPPTPHPPLPYTPSCRQHQTSAGILELLKDSEKVAWTSKKVFSLWCFVSGTICAI